MLCRLTTVACITALLAITTIAFSANFEPSTYDWTVPTVEHWLSLGGDVNETPPMTRLGECSLTLVQTIQDWFFLDRSRLVFEAECPDRRYASRDFELGTDAVDAVAHGNRLDADRMLSASMLGYAALYAQPDVIASLIAHGADVNKAFAADITPLMLAVSRPDANADVYIGLSMRVPIYTPAMPSVPHPLCTRPGTITRPR